DRAQPLCPGRPSNRAWPQGPAPRQPVRSRDTGETAAMDARSTLGLLARLSWRGGWRRRWWSADRDLDAVGQPFTGVVHDVLAFLETTGDLRLGAEVAPDGHRLEPHVAGLDDRDPHPLGAKDQCAGRNGEDGTIAMKMEPNLAVHAGQEAPLGI